MRDLGKIVMTQGINHAMEESPSFKFSVKIALDKFKKNDWGKTCKDDSEMNFMALEQNEQVLAVYDSTQGDIWLVTNFYPRKYYAEAFGEPSSQAELLPVTTILFPCEY